MRKELGKIEKAEYGFGGYGDAQIGLSVTITGTSWGVGDFINNPDAVKGTLIQSKKMHVSQLKGIPVEVTFEGNVLQTWRVLEEVL